MVDNETATNHLSLYSDTDYEDDSMYPCSSQSFWSDGDLSVDLDPSSSAISNSFDTNITEETCQIGYSVNTGEGNQMNIGCAQIQSTPYAVKGLTKAKTSFPRPTYGDAKALYKSPVTSFNPSAEGEHAYQELMELTHWANECLSAGLVKVHVNDLAKDLGDGLTLLDLVEVLTGESPPQLHIKPCLQVQKIENIQACLEFLDEGGVSVHSISAEDIVKGNPKVVLALCHCLKRAYGNPTDVSEEEFIALLQKAIPEKTKIARKYDLFNNDELHVDDKITGYCGIPVDLEESDALLEWVSKVTDQLVTDYSDFKDGNLLCRLVKEVLNRSVPETVIEFGSPSEKVSSAVQILREELGSNIVLQIEDVIHSPYKLSLFLKQLRNSLTRDMREDPTYIFNSTRKKCDSNTGSTSETTSQRLVASKLPFVAPSIYQRKLENGPECRGEIEFYEKEKRYHEAQSLQFQADLAENYTAKLDVNGNYGGYPRAIDTAPHGSACDYLNNTLWKDAPDYRQNTDFISSGLNVKKETLSPKEAKWKDSKTRLRESVLPVFQERAASKSQHNLLEESSVFEPSDKWKTPNSHDLKTAGKLSERSNARQRLRELQRNLESLKLKYLCHTENENPRVESFKGGTALKNRDKNHLQRHKGSQLTSSVDVIPNISPSTVNIVPNTSRIYSSLTAKDTAQSLHDSSSAWDNNDILNMTYPAVELNKVLRRSSIDVTSRRRPRSAESRPKSVCSSACNVSPSTYYSKFPDVLNRIKTQKNDGAEFPTSGYIEASESQLYLPRSRPLGVNDPVSARTRKRPPLPEFFSTPNTGLPTRKSVNGLLDNQSHLNDSFVDSVFIEQGSLPVSNTDSVDVTACSTIFSDKEFSSSPFKPCSLTALIRMTAKKASG